MVSVSDRWTSVCSDSLHLFVTLGVLIPRWWKKQYRFSYSLVNWNPRIGIRQLEKTKPEFPRHKQGNGEQEMPAEHESTTISGSNSFIDSASEDTAVFGQNQGVAFWWAVYDEPVWVWITATRVSSTSLLGWLGADFLCRNNRTVLNMCVLLSSERKSITLEV